MTHNPQEEHAWLGQIDQSPFELKSNRRTENLLKGKTKHTVGKIDAINWHRKANVENVIDRDVQKA